MKICSLIASGTEMLFALGLGHQVVGVTEYCNYPPEARTKRVVSKGVIDIYHLSAREVDEHVQQLAREGKSAYKFDTEWLSQIKPDLILTQDMCRSCDLEAKDVMCAIENFEPKPNVLVLNPRRLEDIFTNIARVALAAGVPHRGEILIRTLRSRIQRVTRLVSGVPYRRRVLYLEWTDPPSPAGDWMPEQVTLAGGLPLLSEPGVAPARMNWQVVQESDPDVIIIGPCSHDVKRSLREMPNIAKVSTWWNLRAVRNGEVYIVNSEYFDRPGPRVVNGLEILAQIFHPELDICTLPPSSVVKLEHAGKIPANPAEIIDLFQAYEQPAIKARLLKERAQ